MHAAMSRAGLLLACALALTACSEKPDTRALAICRDIVPALHPDGSKIDIRNEQAAQGVYQVALAYHVVEPGKPGRMAVVRCGFDSVFPSERPVLTAVDNDGQPVSEAQLFIMKRWWLRGASLSAGLAER
jgi:hypothetical protein